MMRFSITWLNAGVEHNSLPNGPFFRSTSYGGTTEICRRANGHLVDLHEPDPAYQPPWEITWFMRARLKPLTDFKLDHWGWRDFLEIVRAVPGYGPDGVQAIRLFEPKSLNGIRRISGASPWRGDVLLPEKPKRFRMEPSFRSPFERKWSHAIGHWNDDPSAHHSARGPVYLSPVRLTPGPLSWQQEARYFDVGWGPLDFRPIRWEKMQIDGVWGTYAMAADTQSNLDGFPNETLRLAFDQLLGDDYLDRWDIDRLKVELKKRSGRRWRTAGRVFGSIARYVLKSANNDKILMSGQAPNPRNGGDIIYEDGRSVHTDPSGMLPIIWEKVKPSSDADASPVKSPLF